jgi:Na+-translocating ferredoxin:NAD+ oxidoreductase RnfG subunit
MILDEIGKDMPITFVVGVTPDFRIRRVALMVFRESRGAEVEDTRFTNQFRGKSARVRLAVGGDIVGVTGATLSSRAFCRGAKKALAICQAVYG